MDLFWKSVLHVFNDDTDLKRVFYVAVPLLIIDFIMRVSEDRIVY